MIQVDRIGIVREERRASAVPDRRSKYKQGGGERPAAQQAKDTVITSLLNDGLVWTGPPLEKLRFAIRATARAPWPAPPALAGKPVGTLRGLAQPTEPDHAPEQGIRVPGLTR